MHAHTHKHKYKQKYTHTHTHIPQVGLPLRLRTFPSGFTAIQGAQHSDDAVCTAIARLVQPKPLQQQQLQGEQQQQQEQEDPEAMRGTPQSLPGGKVVVRPPIPTAASAATDTNATAGGPAAGEDDDLVAGGEDGKERGLGTGAVQEAVDAQLGPAITAPDVARALRIATAIAAEHLLTAEARCVRAGAQLAPLCFAVACTAVLCCCLHRCALAVACAAMLSFCLHCCAFAVARAAGCTQLALPG